MGLALIVRELETIEEEANARVFTNLRTSRECLRLARLS